jgi:predicted  nucleic acid-binding Zn-ribbon protein
LASDSEHPEQQAFDELQQLVRHLGDELATFRRRALQAESRVKAFESAPGGARVNPERVERLERENADLRKRLETARARTRQVLDRVRFLRQQHEGAAR